MTTANRAKIFSPLAALWGYEEEIAEKGLKNTRVPKKILWEEDIGIFSDLLLQVKKGMTVTVTYFKEDILYPALPSLGTYETLFGTVIRIESVFRQLCISNDGAKTVIDFDSLDKLS